MKRKLESMEDKDNSPEVKIIVMPNFQTEISSAAKAEKPPLEQVED